MTEIRSIGTNGYSGPKTQRQYMPPGEYQVGDRLDVVVGIVPRNLAVYLVGIDLAWVIDQANQPPAVVVDGLQNEPDSVEETNEPSDMADDGLPLSLMKVAELRSLADKCAIEGAASMKKAELVEAVAEALAQVDVWDDFDVETPDPDTG